MNGGRIDPGSDPRVWMEVEHRSVNGRHKRYVDASVYLICTPMFVHWLSLSAPRDGILTIVDVDDGEKGQSRSASYEDGRAMASKETEERSVRYHRLASRI